MLFFLHYVKSGDGLETLLSNGPGGAQNFTFHGGLNRIGRAMALDLAANGWSIAVHCNTSSDDAETVAAEIKAGLFDDCQGLSSEGFVEFDQCYILELQSSVL